MALAPLTRTMSRPPRLATFDYRGSFAYSLTFCTCQRRRHFAVEVIVRVVRDQIVRTGTERDFAVLAYCFMPDHVHLLVRGRDSGCDLRGFVKLVRQRASMATAGRHTGALWQDGFYERTLRRDEHVLTAATYIVNNPVRAGLVHTWIEWPHVGGDIVNAMRALRP